MLRKQSQLSDSLQTWPTKSTSLSMCYHDFHSTPSISSPKFFHDQLHSKWLLPSCTTFKRKNLVPTVRPSWYIHRMSLKKGNKSQTPPSPTKQQSRTRMTIPTIPFFFSFLKNVVVHHCTYIIQARFLPPPTPIPSTHGPTMIVGS